jgi:hypothetical protein
MGHYNTDKTLESEGVWLPMMGGGEMKLARIGNPAYKALQKELSRPYQKIIRAGGEIPEKKQEEIMIELFAKTIIKDWKEYPDQVTGEILPFSVERAKEELEKYEDLRNEVATYATDIYNYHAKANKEAAKN